MKTLLLILTCSVGMMAQSFPSSIFTPPVAADNIASTLTSAMAAGDTAAVVVSGTGWLANMYAYICDGTQTGTAGKCSSTFEVMLVTNVNGNILTVTRAQGGTSAVAHAKGKAISNSVTAIYNTVGMAEILALETGIGANFLRTALTPTWNDSGSVMGYGVQIGAVTPLALFRAMQNCPGCQGNDGFGTSITVPSTSTQDEAAGIFGGVSNQSTTTNAVAGRFYGRSIASGTNDGNRVKTWAINTLLEDQTYGTGSTGPYNATVFDYTELINEFDFNVGGPHTKLIGMSIGGNSTAAPESALGYTCNSLGGGFKWDACFLSLDGTGTVGLQLGTLAVGNNTASQPIYMYGRDAGAVAYLGIIQEDANGNLVLATQGPSIQFTAGVAADIVTINATGIAVSAGKNIAMVGSALAGIGSSANTLQFCTDCKNVGDGVTAGAVCVGSGTGALAIRENGAWRCF